MLILVVVPPGAWIEKGSMHSTKVKAVADAPVGVGAGAGLG
jgi:hypothetical protein